MIVKTKNQRIIGIIHIDFKDGYAIITLANGKIGKIKIEDIKEIER